MTPDAERLMELHEAVLAAMRSARHVEPYSEAWLAAAENLGRAQAAFREALFTQPDAGAMAEAQEIVRGWYRKAVASVSTDEQDTLIALFATALTRREAAGFARGVSAMMERAQRIIEDADGSALASDSIASAALRPDGQTGGK